MKYFKTNKISGIHYGRNQSLTVCATVFGLLQVSFGCCQDQNVSCLLPRRSPTITSLKRQASCLSIGALHTTPNANRNYSQLQVGKPVAGQEQYKNMIDCFSK